VDATLEHQLKRLVLFRVVMITTLLAIAISVEMVSETLLRVNSLYLLIIATYLLTLVHIVLLRVLGGRAALVYTQVVADLFVISGLVYLTGGTGTRAGFMLLYPISVLSGSVMLRGRGPLLAGLATLFYAAILVAVRLGVVPPQGLADVPFLAGKHLAFSVFVLGIACATVALTGSYLSQSLRSVGEQLEEVEEQVADLRELNEAIVSSIQSGLLSADAEGRVLYVNPYGARILGRKDPELRGKTVRQVFGSAALEPLSLRARTKVQGLIRLDVGYERPDGVLLTLGVSASPLATGGGGQLLVFQDLTEIRRLEREVRLNEELAAVGEMAAYLAHEIRNPLGSISGSAQVLLAEPLISPEQEHLLDIIRRESKRLSQTLDQFLFQVRPSRHSLEPIDLGPVISEAAMLLRNGSEVGPDHVVEFQADDGPHLCLADRDRILQVFWNLARNGLEAMPGGGVLRIGLTRRSDEILLSIRDEGRGIDGRDQRRIFEPFRSGTPGGTGLGLSIVYRIVKEHSGDITLRSAPRRGTEVEVRLPLLVVEAPGPRPTAVSGL
jgi:two-component system sensor histidine kinase PilS (NtrC family)